MTVTANTIGGAATTNTAPLPVASTIDGVNDYLAIYTNSALATQGINRNTLLGLSSQPVGLTDVQTVKNKIFDNTNLITISDGSFVLQDDVDPTKRAVFQLSGLTTATTRTYTLPDITDTLVTLTATQTLTNKTLTSAILTAPSITNASITADTITGFSTANSGTIYGVGVTLGIVNSAGLLNTVNTAALQTGAVTGAKITNYSTSRRNNSSNITETAALVQTGWVAGQPGVAANISIVITFPVAFTNVPIVTATFGGDTTTVTATLGLGAANINNAYAEAISLTTTGFTVRIVATSNWAANNTVYAQWVAIGT